MVGIYPLWEARKGIWGVSFQRSSDRSNTDMIRFVLLSPRISEVGGTGARLGIRLQGMIHSIDYRDEHAYRMNGDKWSLACDSVDNVRMVHSRPEIFIASTALRIYLYFVLDL